MPRKDLFLGSMGGLVGGWVDGYESHVKDYIQQSTNEIVQQGSLIILNKFMEFHPLKIGSIY